MTALTILIVLMGLLWLIGQGVLLAMVWGQEQRLRSRLDALAREAGLSTESAPRPTRSVPRLQSSPVAQPASRDAPIANAEPPSHVSANDEPEPPAPTNSGPLTFPPPLRRVPPVPPASEPMPPPATSSPVENATATESSGISRTSHDALANASAGPGESDRVDQSSGLPAGSILPDFELPTLGGDRFGRSMLEGKRAVLVFLALGSPGSAAVMESIRSPQVRKRALPDLVLVIDCEEPDAIRRWLGRLPKRVQVVLQDDTELASVLRVPGTPAAYVLDEKLQTRGGLRTGARSVLEAIGIAAAQMTPTARRSTTLTPHAAATQRSFRGLPVGTPAPRISLPLLGGGVWDGSSTQPQLLIFWDSPCLACGAMYDSLIEAAASWTGFDAVVITRGTVEPDTLLDPLRQRVPVALQHGFSVAQAFQVLEAPAAVAVNSDGTIARPPAVGANAVLQLAQELQERTGKLTNPSEEITAP